MIDHQNGVQRPPTSGVPIGMRPPSRIGTGVANQISSNKISIVDNPMTRNGLPSSKIQSGKGM